MKEYKDLQFKAAEDMVSKSQILPNFSQRVEIKSLVSLALNVGIGNGGLSTNIWSCKHTKKYYYSWAVIVSN